MQPVYGTGCLKVLLQLCCISLILVLFVLDLAFLLMTTWQPCPWDGLVQGSQPFCDHQIIIMYPFAISTDELVGYL